ncbi:exported hypothetical protein [Cupriavidus taiwanensis]|nr:exported hypothetical protein [Cupriavidus taiwanensis]
MAHAACLVVVMGSLPVAGTGRALAGRAAGMGSVRRTAPRAFTHGPGAQRPGQPPRVPRAGVNHKIQDLVMRGDFGFQTHNRPVCDYSNPGTVHWRSLALSHPRQSP